MIAHTSARLQEVLPKAGNPEQKFLLKTMVTLVSFSGVGISLALVFADAVLAFGAFGRTPQRPYFCKSPHFICSSSVNVTKAKKRRNFSCLLKPSGLLSDRETV